MEGTLLCLEFREFSPYKSIRKGDNPKTGQVLSDRPHFVLEIASEVFLFTEENFLNHILISLIIHTVLKNSF